MDISKSVILITAAGTPTGRAIAEHFCALGAKVALVDANERLLDNTHQSCVRKYTFCCPFLLKDKDVDNINQIFNDVKNTFGSIDVLVNYWQPSNTPNLLDEHSNLENPIADVTSNLYIFGRCAAACMMDKGQGVIINIPCLQKENPTMHDLTSSHSVIRGLTQSWGQELENTNIRVGGVLTRIRRYDCGKIHPQLAINYDMIDSITYIVENDSFTCRVLEVS